MRKRSTVEDIRIRYYVSAGGFAVEVFAAGAARQQVFDIVMLIKALPDITLEFAALALPACFDGP